MVICMKKKFLIGVTVAFLLVVAGCSDDKGKDTDGEKEKTKQEVKKETPVAKPTMTINEKSVEYDGKLASLLTAVHVRTDKEDKIVVPEKPTDNPQYHIQVVNGKETSSFEIWDDGLDFILHKVVNGKDEWAYINNSSYQEVKEALTPYMGEQHAVLLNLSVIQTHLATVLEPMVALEISPELTFDGAEQFKFCNADTTPADCVYVYVGKTVEDGDKFHKQLEDKLAMMNFAYVPKVEKVHNAVFMYIPKDESYALQKPLEARFNLLR